MESKTEQKSTNNGLGLSKPLNLLVIGMAGSGKTTFMGMLHNYLMEKKNVIPYSINMDPAVQFTPYSPAGDIRKMVNYKEIMKKYGLGPNGAIMTSLNLYAAQFHLTLEEMEKAQEHHELFLIDTPGQIEVFTWSASGLIISSTIANMNPTAIVFVLDTQRCQNPNTFMSNMMFCCSILYKTKLPMIVVFNKSDVADVETPIKWMTDFESFMDEVRKGNNYLSSLSRSMALALDEFYSELNHVAVSSKTGKGFEEFIQKLPGLVEEYNEIYLPNLKQRKSPEELEKEKARVEKELKKVDKALSSDKLTKNN